MTVEPTVAGARRLWSVWRVLRAAPEDLRRLQDRRFLQLIEAARRAEPYRSLYADLMPERLRGIDDLSRLPVIDRTHLLPFPLEARLSSRPEPLVLFSTSGTTGRPVEFAWSEGEAAGQALCFFRQRLAQGLPIRGPAFVVDLSRRRQLTRVMIGNRSTELSVPQTPEALAEAIRSTEPTVLVGDPSLLLEIGRALGRYPLGGLVTAGEMLDPETRAALEEVFGVRPFDLYASGEGGQISWECPSGAGYHVNADAIIVEVLDAGGRPVPPGETGDVVLTNLWNRTAPLVRYRIGDVAALLPGPFPCGVPFPLMSQVEGRSNDWVVGADGLRVSPLRLLLVTLLGDEWRDATRRYRIVQRAIDDFLVQVEWSAGRRPDLIERIAPLYASILGGPVGVEVEDVAEVPRSSSGKFRMVESWVPARA